MHKDEFVVVMVVIGIAVLVMLLALSLVAFGAVHVSTVHSGGCNHVPLVNGQPAYPCTNTPPP
jgi:hypothetical protein